MKKKTIKIVIVIISLLLLIPIKLGYKDGGTIKYQAVLYSITDWHAIRGTDFRGFYTGIEIKILGITIYKDTKIEQ